MCIDPTADNFAPLANIENGDCYFERQGCTDSNAKKTDNSEKEVILSCSEKKSTLIGHVVRERFKALAKHLQLKARYSVG